MAIEWDKNTLLLLHGESLDDSSFYTVPITNNGAEISSEQSKFGVKSFYFAGNSSLTFDSSVCDFKDGDFTVDWWEYQTVTPKGARFCTQLKANTGFSVGNGGTSLNLNKSYKTPGWDVINASSVLSASVNEWTHWAVERYGTSILVFKNGQKAYEKSIGDITLEIDLSISSAIGVNAGNNQFFTGYIDEFRISDVARWTEDFTPPTEPYKPYTGSYVPEPEPGDEPVDPSEFQSKLDWSVRDYLNHDALTRIEKNCKILNDKLREYGYIAPIDFRKWDVGEYPTPTQLERIRSNINALQDAWFAVPEWRELMAVYRPDKLETINAEQVNAQEWDLQQMYDYLQAMVKVFELKQSGTLFMIAGGIYNAG